MFPVPATDWRYTFHGRVATVMVHITFSVGTEASTREGISVNRLIIWCGHRKKNTSSGNIVTVQSISTRRITGNTPSGWPSPMMLLTSVAAVEAKAAEKTNGTSEILRTMLAIASCSSPKCSIKRKKSSHTEIFRTYSNITQEAVENVCLSSVHAGLTIFCRPYFLSAVKKVHTTKKSKDIPSEMVDANAAPLMPIAGAPRWPKMSTQSKKILLLTSTMEFHVRLFVSHVPT